MGKSEIPDFFARKIFSKGLDSIYICTYTLAQPKNFGWEAYIMAKEDKFADEIMSDDELDQVAGGTKSEFRELQRVLPKITDRIRNDVTRCYEDVERSMTRDEVVRACW